MTRDPAKRKATKQRYCDKRKAEKYGPDAVGKDMRGRHGHHARGSASGSWNNGRMRTSHGYIALAVPVDHHLRQAHGYAYEHQLVAEETMGRRLRPDEVVHHLNGRRDDNRPENLHVTTRSAHARDHSAAPDARDAMGRFKAGSRHASDDGVRSIQEFPR